MGIDRVGKGGSTPPVTGTPATAPTKETGKAFEAHKPSEATAVSGQTPLDQLRAGTLDVNGYLNLKVKEATAHLGALSPVQLDTLRGLLREQLSNDPTLASLFEKATGAAPPQPADE